MHRSNSVKMTNSAIFYQWEERAEHVWRTGDLKRRHFRNSLMILSLLLLSSRQATSAPMYKSSGGSLPILLLWLKWNCNRIAFEFWDVSIWIQLVIKSRNTSHIGSWKLYHFQPTAITYSCNLGLKGNSLTWRCTDHLKHKLALRKSYQRICAHTCNYFFNLQMMRFIMIISYFDIWKKIITFSYWQNNSPSITLLGVCFCCVVCFCSLSN